jgi:hypothetical protein
MNEMSAEINIQPKAENIMGIVKCATYKITQPNVSEEISPPASELKSKPTTCFCWLLAWLTLRP